MATQQELLLLKIEAQGDDELTAIARKLAEIGASGSEAAPKAQALLEELAKLSGQQQLIDTLIREKVALQETGDQLALQKLKLADLQKQMAATTTPSAALERAFAKTQSTIATLDGAYNQHQANLTRAGNALRAAGVDTEHLDTSQRGVAQAITNTSTAAAALAKSAAGASAAHEKLAKSTDETGKKTKEAGGLLSELRQHLAEIISVAAAVEIGLKSIEFAGDSVKQAAAVEASLSRVKALAQGAANEFAGMESAIDAAAKAVNEDGSFAAAGLAKLAENGLSAKNAIDALIPTLQLAKIANIDTATAAGIVADALKAYELPGTAAQQVVDQLTAASHGAAGGLAAMSGAAAQLAPDARALGLTLTDVTSILGLLSSKGLDVEKGVKGLRGVFQSLQDPTSELRGELLALGDGTGDFSKAVAVLTSGTPEATRALHTLSGPTRTLIELLGQAGPAAIATFNASLQQTEGLADRTTNALDDNLTGSFKRFTLAVDDIGEALAKPILEPLGAEFKKLAKELNEFAESDNFKTIKEEIGKIATDGIKILDDALHDFDWKGFAKNAKEALKDVGENLKAIAESATTIGSVIGTVTGGLGVAYQTLGAATDVVVASTAKGAEAILTLEERALGAARGSDELHDALRSVGDVAEEQAGQRIGKLVDKAAQLGAVSEEAAGAVEAEGDAHAQAAPKVDVHGAAVDKYADAMERFARLERDATVELPTMVVRLGQAAGSVETFADRLAAGSTKLADFKDQSGKAVEGADAVATAMSKLRIRSQQDLEEAAAKAQTYFNTVNKLAADTAAGLADRQNAFLAFAPQALAASVQQGEAVRAAVQAELESQAAALGVSQALADLEEQSAKSHAALTSDADRGAAALKRELEQAEQLSGKFQEGAQSAQQAGDATEDMANRGTGAMNALADRIASTRGQFLAVSDAAAKAFDRRLLQDFNTEMDSTGIGLSRVLSAVNDAAAQTNEQLANERAQLQGIIDHTDTIGTQSVQSFAKLGVVVQNLTDRQLSNMIASIRAGTYDAGLLGQQELQPLLAALEGAKQRVDGLRAATQQANQAIADLNGNLQDQLDQQAGNQVAIENRNYETQRKHIEDLAAQADASGKRQADDALAKLNELHQAKLKAIADEAAAQQRANEQARQQAPQEPSAAAGGGTATAAGGATSGGAAQPAGSVARASAAATGGSVDVNVTHTLNLSLGDATAGLFTDSVLAKLSDQLVPLMGQKVTYEVIQSLKRDKGRTFG